MGVPPARQKAFRAAQKKRQAQLKKGKGKKRKIGATGGLAEVLRIGPGCRVMLRKNHDVSKGLVNGAMGTVLDLVKAPNSNRVLRVKVDFEGVGCVLELKPQAQSFEQGSLLITRSQFPLVLAWGITIHKSQGLTLDAAVASLGEGADMAGMCYVALSRVKRLDSLYLAAFDPSSIKCSVKAGQEYQRLRKEAELEAFTSSFNQLPEEYARVREERAQIRKDRAVGADAQKMLNTEVLAQCQPAPAPDPDQSAIGGQRMWLPIQNNGWNCYANATFQSVFSLPGMAETLMSLSVTSDVASQVEEVASLQNLLSQPRDRKIDSAPAIQWILEEASRLNRTSRGQPDDPLSFFGSQQDPRDFLTYLLNTLPPEVSQSFELKTADSKQCQGCGSRTEGEEHSGHVLTWTMSQEEMVWREVMKENLESPITFNADCISCGGKGLPHLKESHLVETGQFLVITLPVNLMTPERGMHRMVGRKIKGFNAQLTEIPTSKGVDRFRLCATILHQGETNMAGHYISVIRNRNQGKGWWVLDDLHPLNAVTKPTFIQNLSFQYQDDKRPSSRFHAYILLFEK